ncbi:MAG: type II toxin-antitoxin system RatA family toxin [Hyphomicrobiales bacterium]|nr:type II toxin-antitoxin system RatA family toxin [Hyphomicrobiales bacterium]
MLHDIRLRRKSPYSAAQMYALVADVARYREFLPYCVESRILKRQRDRLSARLGFAHKVWRDSFLSDLRLDEARGEIRVRGARGIFSQLSVQWRFADDAKGGSVVEVALRFGLAARALSSLFRPLRRRTVEKAVQVFEARADALYGSARKKTS